jgi:hypothetical protein
MSQGELSFRPSRSAIVLCGALALLGGGALLYGFLQDAERAWPNLLLVSFYLLGLGLGALVFVALQYVTGAGWSVGLRRVPEAMAAILPVAALGLAVVFLASPGLYPWARSTTETEVSSQEAAIQARSASDRTAPLVAGAPGWYAGAHALPGRGGPLRPAPPLRRAWFTEPFFLARGAVYLAGWLLLGMALVRNSRRQDQDGDPRDTRKNVRLSAAFLVVFGVTFWLASTDWIMSLEPEWSSTIFAVYQFAGVFLSGLAAIIVLAAWLRLLGPFCQVFTRQHAHDLGKLLFGFSTFWMYLWFCQYMLIWYVNNPEETAYFTRRLDGAWRPLFFLNLVLNWGIPFVVLLPRATKQRFGILAAVSLVILAGRWLDLYLGILPYFGEPAAETVAWEFGLMLGAAGLFGLVFFAALRKSALIPVGDPYLVESLPPAEARLGLPGAR